MYNASISVIDPQEKADSTSLKKTRDLRDFHTEPKEMSH
jgi:hypothetical protein